METKRKRALATVVLLVAMLGAAACYRNQEVVPPSGDQQTGISVSGRGEVEAPPDTGFFSVGVEVSASTVAAARENAAKAADAVINAVKRNGVDDKDIKTTHYSINPVYDFKSGNQPRITGYTVTNLVEVKVRKLDDFSKIIDAASTAGGDDARVQSISFDIEDTARLLEQAREAAMKDAKGKAEQLARLGGVGLGTPIQITETAGTNPPIAVAERSAGAVADTATPIQPGTGSVVVSVTVVWSLSD